MVGVGTQVLVITLCVFMLSLVGMFYPYNRGAMLSACVVLYALTAGISGEPHDLVTLGGRCRCPAVLAVCSRRCCRTRLEPGAPQIGCYNLLELTTGSPAVLPAGYVSGVWYKMMGGTQWVSNVLLVSVLFCGPLLGVFSVLNTIAWVQGSTQALPFGTICIIVVIWALVTFPLTVLGGIAGKNSREEFAAPCR